MAAPSVSNGELYSDEGVIVETGENFFVMETEDSLLESNRIIVEVDDWNTNYSNDYNIGDQVVVYGRADKDAYERFKIEARKVVFPITNKVLYANPVDEEATIGAFGQSTAVPDFTQKVETVFIGKIVKTDEDGFLLQSRLGAKFIDVSRILNDAFVKSLNVGRSVRVHGDVEENIFSKDKIVANLIIKL